MLATDYAGYYNLAPQGETESDIDFRKRVASHLRRDGKVVEAHEVYHDARWDNNGNVLTGVLGAVAQAMQGTRYGGNPLDNDIVAGEFVKYQMSPEGERAEKEKETIATLLTLGLSPDDIKGITGR